MRLETSPYDTRQEQYRDDPWKMLLVCFMLNQTSHKQVDQIREAFFERFPNAESLVSASESEIADMIRPLGFYNRRAKMWKKFSVEWIEILKKYDPIGIPLDQLENMSGVGKYALDSWRVFQLYDYDVEPNDHVLNWYVDWARKEVERIKREGSEAKPMSVYYLHYEEEREVINNWNKCSDYVCCIMARTQNEAIEITKSIALRQKNAKHIKVLGIGFCKEEWTQMVQPMRTDEKKYRQQVQDLFAKIYSESGNIYKG